jgi:ADP-heptose:LPS heptosyltransferase
MNRHFKKYYFYFLARVFDVFKQFEKSISCYSKVIGYRTFFWDVQSRYERACRKGQSKKSLQIQGGIGDILQHLPFILKNKSTDYIVATHYLDAQRFFEDLGIKVKQYYFYSNHDENKVIREKLKNLNHSYICPRSLFFDQSPFKSQANLKLDKQFTVGIHMGAGKMEPHKALSAEFAQNLIKELNTLNYKIILFGTSKEINALKVSSNNSLIIPTSSKIVDSLSLVGHCDFFIGSDSAFKTMASMLKIPTIVIYENSLNNFRDRVFIEPYLDNEVMYVYKYKKLDGPEIKKAIQYSLQICRSHFNAQNN